MEDGIFFDQSRYNKEMLKKFGLEESKPMKTPMSSDTKHMKDEECESVDSTKYRGMIGSLLYLMASRPDIMFSGCLCARFQEDPKTSHLEAVKRKGMYKEKKLKNSQKNDKKRKRQEKSEKQQRSKPDQPDTAIKEVKGQNNEARD
ncbi:hypothetical protein Tco_1376017 [Tanacetum coccineum]